MCGIGIRYKENFIDFKKLVHRGISNAEISSGDYTMYHSSLPLQTYQMSGTDQPIPLGEGRYLLYNGEIFNYPGYFRSDVEYLIFFFSKKDYQKRILAGETSFWDGFWAIAIVDTENSTITAFTDPLGKKQLYTANGCLSSEIKPLLTGSPKVRDFKDPPYPRGEETPFEGVSRLIPNRLYTIKKDQGHSYSLDHKLVDLTCPPEEDHGLKYHVSRAVERRTINRVDGITVFVSGGLDSTILLSHLRKEPDFDQMELLTIDNEEDGEFIRILEDWLGRRVRRISPGSDEERLEAIKAYEHPMDFGSVFPQWDLCKAATNRVIYTGDGADELFSGYNRALVLDTQKYDIFSEIPYYHNIRMDRMSMAFTKEIRSPFLSHDLVRWATNTHWTSRVGKKQLREAYFGEIPRPILERGKNPLRVQEMRDSKKMYQQEFKQMFNSINFAK